MRIFVSHSHEQESIAAQLAARMRADGHRVFQNDSSLLRGDAFDRRIREQLGTAQLFVFLLSPGSVRPGCYALTELGLAQRRWPNPALRVLPVMVVPTDEAAIPAYLRAVNIMRPTGEPIAEVLAEIDSRRRSATHRLRRRLLLAASCALMTIVVYAQWPTRAPGHVDLDTGYARPNEPSGPTPPVAPSPPPAVKLPGPAAKIHPQKPKLVHPGAGTAAANGILWQRAGCVARVEIDQGRPWAVCRCQGTARGDVSLPLEQSSLLEARKEIAGRWQCPRD